MLHRLPLVTGPNENTPLSCRLMGAEDNQEAGFPTDEGHHTHDMPIKTAKSQWAQGKGQSLLDSTEAWVHMRHCRSSLWFFLRISSHISCQHLRSPLAFQESGHRRLGILTSQRPAIPQARRCLFQGQSWFLWTCTSPVPSASRGSSGKHKAGRALRAAQGSTSHTGAK